MGKKAKLLAMVIAVVVIGVGVLVGSDAMQRIPKSAQDAIARFHSQQAAEDQLMDPLILAGKDVVPLVEGLVADRNEPLRRYAIGALGNIGAPSSLKVLENVVQNQSDEGYVRCDALTAIGLIDREAALRLAGQYGSAFDCSTTVNALQDYERWKSGTYMRRTYLQALLGRHD